MSQPGQTRLVGEPRVRARPGTTPVQHASGGSSISSTAANFGSGASSGIGGGMGLPGIIGGPGALPGGSLTPVSTARSQESGRGGVSGGAALPIGMPNRMEVLPHEDLGIPGSTRQHHHHPHQNHNAFGNPPPQRNSNPRDSGPIPDPPVRRTARSSQQFINSNGNNTHSQAALQQQQQPESTRRRSNGAGASRAVAAAANNNAHGSRSTARRERRAAAGGARRRAASDNSSTDSVHRRRMSTSSSDRNGRGGGLDSDGNEIIDNDDDDDDESYTSSTLTTSSSSDSIRHSKAYYSDVAPDLLAEAIRTGGTGGGMRQAARSAVTEEELDAYNEHQEEEEIIDESPPCLLPPAPNVVNYAAPVNDNKRNYYRQQTMLQLQQQQMQGQQNQHHHGHHYQQQHHHSPNSLGSAHSANNALLPSHNSSVPAVAPIVTPPRRVADVDRLQARESIDNSQGSPLSNSQYQRDQQQQQNRPGSGSRVNLPPMTTVAAGGTTSASSTPPPNEQQQMQHQHVAAMQAGGAGGSSICRTTSNSSSAQLNNDSFGHGSPVKDLPPLPPAVATPTTSSDPNLARASMQQQQQALGSGRRLSPDAQPIVEPVRQSQQRSPQLKPISTSSSPTTTTAAVTHRKTTSGGGVGAVASSNGASATATPVLGPAQQQQNVAATIAVDSKLQGLAPTQLSLGQLDQERSKSDESGGMLSPQFRHQQQQQQQVRASAAQNRGTPASSSSPSSPAIVSQQQMMPNNNNNNNGNQQNHHRQNSLQQQQQQQQQQPSTTPSHVRFKPRRVHLGRRDLIGKGSFGNVYRGIDMDTNRLLAVKEIVLVADNAHQRGGQLDKIQREIHVSMRLEHPNIVRCFGEMWDEEQKCLRIFMEYVAGGTLSSLIRAFGPVTERQASRFVKHILKGLRYLHEQRIAHRDLKGDNLLIDSDGVLKLADFGTAKELMHTSERMNTVTGTAFFMAPEVIRGTGHGFEADIWSVGCCVFEMLHGKPPLADMFHNHYAAMVHVASFKEATLPLPPMNSFSDECKDFIAQCLRNDPAARPTCQALLEHPWVKTLPPLFDRSVDPAVVRAAPGGIVVHELPRPDPIVMASNVGGLRVLVNNNNNNNNNSSSELQQHQQQMQQQVSSSVTSPQHPTENRNNYHHDHHSSQATSQNGTDQQQQQQQQQHLFRYENSQTPADSARLHRSGRHGDDDNDDEEHRTYVGDENTDRDLRDEHREQLMLSADEYTETQTPSRGTVGASPPHHRGPVVAGISDLSLGSASATGAGVVGGDLCVSENTTSATAAPASSNHQQYPPQQQQQRRRPEADDDDDLDVVSPNNNAARVNNNNDINDDDALENTNGGGGVGDHVLHDDQLEGSVCNTNNPPSPERGPQDNSCSPSSASQMMFQFQDEQQPQHQPQHSSSGNTSLGVARLHSHSIEFHPLPATASSGSVGGGHARTDSRGSPPQLVSAGVGRHDDEYVIPSQQQTEANYSPGQSRDFSRRAAVTTTTSSPAASPADSEEARQRKRVEDMVRRNFGDDEEVNLMQSFTDDK